MKRYLLNLYNTFLYNQQKHNINRTPQIISEFDGVFIQIKKLRTFEIEGLNLPAVEILKDDCYEISIIMNPAFQFEKETFYLFYSKGFQTQSPRNLRSCQHSVNGKNIFIHPENHTFQLRVDRSLDNPSTLQACDELNLPYTWFVYITNANHKTYDDSYNGYYLSTYEQA
jgi:hypothetical protein